MIEAQAKNLEFQMCEIADQPRMVVGDQERLWQILNNLILNAIKFTARGKVEISCNTIGGGLIEFQVQDTGSGFNKAELESSFEDLFQTDVSSLNFQSNSGLGLPIARELCRAMHGDLLYENRPEGGARFRAQVVLKEVARDLLDDKQAEAQSADRKLKILLVEDDPISAMILQKFLKENGMDVTLCQNGLEGLESCKQHQYDIIFMDVQMPVMDGVTATRHIRESVKGKNDLPIIGISAHTSEESMQEALQAGMNLYLTKPFDRERLLEAIRQYASRA